jgi:hypothetical protein
VVPVLIWFLLMAMLLTACVAAAWPGSAASRGAAGQTFWSTDRRPALGQSVASSSRLESLEGVLVAQLASEGITRRQYLRAMERLAARDDERNPLLVPPDAAPPEAGAGS